MYVQCMARMTLQERLDSHLDKSAGPDGCWVWTASKTRGYGQIGITENGRVRHALAHRVAYELAHGVTLGEECILHRCDNPPCCNPAHLFLGDRKANSDDKIAKGRHRSRSLPGEDHGMSKVTDTIVREMRALYAEGTISQPQLAKRFGIRQSTVWAILHRRTWKHVA